MSLWIVLVVRFLATPASTTTMLGPTPTSQPPLLSRYSRAASVIRNIAYPNACTPAWQPYEAATLR